MESAPHANERPRIEPAKLERVHVEALLHLRIPGEHDLKASIEKEAVDVVGPYPTANAVGSLEHLTIDARSNEILGTRETGETSAHDDYIDHADRSVSLSAAYVPPPRAIDARGCI